MGFLKKLFGLDKSKDKSGEGVKFLGEVQDKVSHTMPITQPVPKEHYIIKHEGEYLIFNSKDEMPEEIKEAINNVEQVESLSISSVYNVIIDGKRHRYNSYSEIPEHIRKIIESKKN